MNKMDEDEAIQTLRNHVCWVKSKNVKQAIETILDLYQQEKEKNNKIEKYIRSNEWAEDYEKSSCRTKILRILEE